jgi:hypothetical protein
MRIRSFGFAATVLLALASAPPPAFAQTLPSDVEEKLGLPKNRVYPPHVRRELLRRYEHVRRQEMAEERVRGRYDDDYDDRRRYRRSDRYDDEDDRRRYRRSDRYDEEDDRRRYRPSYRDYGPY